MIGYYAFCHRSGAPLSEPTHYDEDGRAWRSVLPGDGDDDDRRVGELTNGEVRSTRQALVTYFRRTHRRHCEFDAELYRRAALAISRLKRAATGEQTADRYVWYALQHRFDELGYDVEWMHAHAGLRCPGCHGRLKFDDDHDGVVHAECGTNCDGTTSDQMARIRETVASLYTAAFDGSAAHPEEVLQF